MDMWKYGNLGVWKYGSIHMEMWKYWKYGNMERDFKKFILNCDGF